MTIFFIVYARLAVILHYNSIFVCRYVLFYLRNVVSLPIFQDGVSYFRKLLYKSSTNDSAQIHQVEMLLIKSIVCTSYLSILTLYSHLEIIFFRLTPAVVSIFILVITISRYVGNGPMYQLAISSERDKCLENWWSFFLNVQNYVNYSNVVSYSNVNIILSRKTEYLCQCLVPTWYLSADWQLFLVSLLVVIPVTLMVANRSFKWIMSTMLAFNVLFTLVPTLMKYVYDDYAKYVT